VITGASSGIGLELARLCARRGYDLLLAADRPLQVVLDETRALGVRSEGLMIDLSSATSVELLCAALADKPIDLLIANAGHGLGRAFLDQDLRDIGHVIDTNISGTVHLVHHVGNMMRSARGGRILITGSIAGFLPGTFQAVYSGTKAFIDSFARALRHELKSSGVHVTCLMPGATDTDFFRRANLSDPTPGDAGDIMDPAEVARIGFDAMMEGAGTVIPGIRNRTRSVMSGITPAGVLVAQRRRMTDHRTGK
jgi:short-subunit dehydrogenase